MTKPLKKCPICGGKVEGEKTGKITNTRRDFVKIQKIREELNNKIPVLKQIMYIYAYPVAESV
ncbi:MAG: hypothetical protein CVT88_02515 [Candidatus Altiarchaeales archaeon HGW-Altiarchaeales-1]|nr:MAG: hypothetical protein CVT88_02515 [Candidatus Altiarchaeales archaeon HGW-Altiarchaeales-1]